MELITTILNDLFVLSLYGETIYMYKLIKILVIFVVLINKEIMQQDESLLNSI